MGHTAVWGPTGAGKSTFLNLLEMQFFKYPGSLVVVFDKGRSCRQPCLAAGGLFYEPAGENPGGVSLQPLRDLETERELMDAMDFIESCFRVNRYEVTPPMRAAIRESLELLREKPPGARTLTSFVHYVNYLDPQTKKPLFNEQLGDYLWDGGKYGKIFDARSSDIRLCARFLAFEMEALMNRGEGCVVPALVYLFNLVEKMFDGRLTLLVLDEAWLFLRNPAFADKITEWLKVLRKKNVFVLFATQEVADVEKSPLKSTVIQQCLTKIYLADPSAATEAMADVYRAFGLTDAEIGLIASATMKRDYFYTSPLGRRLFRLDLGPLTLALTGSPDHALLDDLLLQNGPGLPLCEDILSAKTVPWESLLGPDEQPERPARPASPRQAPAERPQSQDVLPEPNPPEPLSRPGRRLACELLQAAGNLPERKKNDGSGRAACLIARQFGVSPATVYQVRRLLRQADPELLEDLRAGRISIKAACKRLPREKQPENPAAV